MAKKFEAGFAKILLETTLDDKTGKVMDNLDKMSAQGWEYRGMIEVMPGHLVLLYQREVEPQESSSSPASEIGNKS